MTKRQLIDEIRRHNETVQSTFLQQFDEAALKQYLEHLKGAMSKRVKITNWAKPQPRMRMVG